MREGLALRGEKQRTENSVSFTLSLKRGERDWWGLHVLWCCRGEGGCESECYQANWVKEWYYNQFQHCMLCYNSADLWRGKGKGKRGRLLPLPVILPPHPVCFFKHGWWTIVSCLPLPFCPFLNFYIIILHMKIGQMINSAMSPLIGHSVYLSVFINS